MVLSGMDTMEQVLDNTSYMPDFKALNEEEYKVIEKVSEIINANTVVPCAARKYCVPYCPKKIAIPGYFALYNSAKRAVTDDISSQFVHYMKDVSATFDNGPGLPTK